jgi:hypothetical protein
MCCRTCEHRNHAVHAQSTTNSLLSVCIIALTFKEACAPRTKTHTALKLLLNNIVDDAESLPHPSTFTSWSPCLSDPKAAVIVTTASDSCFDATLPIYADISRYLAEPPSIQHIYVDHSAVGLGVSDPNATKACDIFTLKAPTLSVASEIGNTFGWDPERYSLSSRIESNTPSTFLHLPGDLIRDFRAWSERSLRPSSRSNSLGSSSYRTLHSTNSDEQIASPDEPLDQTSSTQETLVMVFSWHDHTSADRFKHPLLKSYGPNREDIQRGLWEETVAQPVRAMEELGAEVHAYKLELRAVEPRGEAPPRARADSKTKRLGLLASELGGRVSGRVSGLWR